MRSFEFYRRCDGQAKMRYIRALHRKMTTAWLRLQKIWRVSRQAVYDNIKRTEKILEDYEMKLHIYSILCTQILIRF